MFAMKLNSIKNSQDVKMADFSVLAVCSVKREIMHTSHTLCRLAHIDRCIPLCGKNCKSVCASLNQSHSI